MYRIYMLWGVLTLFVLSETQTQVDSSIQLQNYNHKLAVKLEKKKKIQSLARISEKEAIERAEAFCQEKVTSQYISHHGQLLYYVVHTPNCIVKINALDGKKISLKKKSKETDK